MITSFSQVDGHIERSDVLAPAGNTPLWIDLLDPSPEEIKRVEHWLDLELPTRDEVKEIETSSRLYEDNGAHYMTMTYVAKALEEEPQCTQMTFVMKKNVLVTLRYVETRLISHFMTRFENRSGEQHKTPAAVFVSLLDVIVDYWSDILEYESNTIDTLGSGVFADSKRTDYRALLKQMGKMGTLNSKMQESLVSLSRLQVYAIDVLDWMGASRESKSRLASLGTDLNSLLEQTSASTDRMTFLLDATLGLVSIEQNAIIKIFSVAAVIFLPPTLVASIYGMNFDNIPELHLAYGYPIALILMVFSAIVPFVFFKHKGWL